MSRPAGPREDAFAGVAMLILAGGLGTRLWPLSTAGRPKQFAALVDPGRSMLRTTWDRLAGAVAPEQVFVTVLRGYEALALAQLPDLPRENLLTVPEQRNTLPSLGVAAAHIERAMPGATLVVLSADNAIGDVHAYTAALQDCVRSARAGAHVVALGVPASGPSTQYGYMGRGAPAPFADSACYGTDYLEKPPREVAEHLVAGGRHDWNAGIFAVDLDVLFHACRLHAPAHQDVVEQLRGLRPPRGAEADALFHRLPAVDLDRGLMERLTPWSAAGRRAGDPGLVLVRGTFAWDDVGSFESLGRHLPRDGGGNAVFGDVTAPGSTGCVLVAQPPYRLQVQGVHDAVVVVSDEGQVLTRPREDAGPVPATGIRGLEMPGCRVAVDDLTVTVSAVTVSAVTATGGPPTTPAVQSPATAALEISVDTGTAVASERVAAALVRDLAELLGRTRRPVLVVSAGDTPVEVYRLLRTRYAAALPWSGVRLFQMDEYCGVPGSTGSFAAFLRAALVEPLGLPARLLTGSETPARLAAHEAEIEQLGGIDLLLHGIGANGHLGFNEPGSDFRSAARRVLLSVSTRERITGPAAVPTEGVTLGLGLLTRARRVRVMATGASKRDAVLAALLGPAGEHCPASSLQGHADVRWYLDTAAAGPALVGSLPRPGAPVTTPPAVPPFRERQEPVSADPARA